MTDDRSEHTCNGEDCQSAPGWCKPCDEAEADRYRMPEQWCQHYGVVILDPDGWRGKDAFPWDARISRTEFHRRALLCTVDNRGDGWRRLAADVAAMSAPPAEEPAASSDAPTGDADAQARILSVYVQCAKRFAWTPAQTDEAMAQLGGEGALLEFLSAPEPPAPIKVGVGMPAAILLDAFGEWLHQAFGATAYLVGSAFHGKSWRDVDVRLLMADDAFHALFPGYRTANQGDSKWSLMCAAISVLAKQQTGLPIDFQIQSASEANERYPGPRNPLRLRRHEEA